MESASRCSRAGLRAARVFVASFAAVLAVIAAPPVCAAEYDWSDPEERETGAVLAALRDGGGAPLETLLYDGLEPDQRLPEGRASVPVISLAVKEGNQEAVMLLLAEGADLDAMSTGMIEDSAALNESFRQLSM